MAITIYRIFSKKEMTEAGFHAILELVSEG